MLWSVHKWQIATSYLSYTLTYISENGTPCCDGKLSEHIVHHRLLPMRAAQLQTSQLPHAHQWKHLQWVCEHQKWTMKQWKDVAWCHESHFLLKHMKDSYLCVIYLGKRKDALWEEGMLAEWVWCFGQCSTWKPLVLVLMWMIQKHSTYLNIVTEQVHLFLVTVFFNGGGLF